MKGISIVSLTQLQEIPPEDMILLTGPPGTGKNDFCQQAILRRLAIDNPVIYVTTECSPSKAEAHLKERGLGKIEPGLLHYVDAYNETVGLSVPERTDTVHADCSNLSSIGIAIIKLQKRIREKGVLLVFDSLVSLYLLSGPELLRFLRLTLSRFAAEGNSILMCMDKGSAKQEDLSTMMSLSNGVIEMEIEKGKQILNIVKHPKMKLTTIEVPTDKTWKSKYYDSKFWTQEMMESGTRFMQGKPWVTIRKEVNDYVNVFWPNLTFWGAMLWDPKNFSKKTYELIKESTVKSIKEALPQFPWNQRLLFNLIMPKSFSTVKNMKKLFQKMSPASGQKTKSIFGIGDGILEYLEDKSQTDEHYFRVDEYYECWGFSNVGAPMATVLPPTIAAFSKGFEKEERDWNAIETKCVGLGDPYCEFKLIPGEINELQSSLEKDLFLVEKISDRLTQDLNDFLLNGKPLIERPRLGSDIHLQGAPLLQGFPAMAGERYRIAWRMGGAKIGKRIGEKLKNAGIGEDEAVKRILHFLKHCKVGKVSMDETIKIIESCESVWTRFYTATWKEPCCFFTTGFLNGFFSTVKNQHVKETKCIAIGDPYCEWEFR